MKRPPINYIYKHSSFIWLAKELFWKTKTINNVLFRFILCNLLQERLNCVLMRFGRVNWQIINALIHHFNIICSDIVWFYLTNCIIIDQTDTETFFFTVHTILWASSWLINITLLLRTDGTTTARWVVMTDRNGWEKVVQSNVDRVWSIMPTLELLPLNWSRRPAWLVQGEQLKCRQTWSKSNTDNETALTI